MWEVLYSDGTIHTSDELSWDQLPRNGVIGIMEFGNLYRGSRLRTLSCGNYYHHPPGIFATDERLYDDDLEGELLPDELFEELIGMFVTRVRNA